jgi:hypothetical protein
MCRKYSHQTADLKTIVRGQHHLKLAHPIGREYGFSFGYFVAGLLDGERRISEHIAKTKKLTITVLDFGRPSISGSIRSIKIYSWA